MHWNDEGGGALLAACALVSLLAAGTTIVRLRENARAALGNPSARVDVFAAGRAVEGYALTFGALPERLEVTGQASDVYDPWGRRLVYLRKGGHDFTVECLGRDGLVGGAGEDQDFVYASTGGVGRIVVPAVGAGDGRDELGRERDAVGAGWTSTPSPLPACMPCWSCSCCSSCGSSIGTRRGAPLGGRPIQPSEFKTCA